MSDETYPPQTPAEFLEAELAKVKAKLKDPAMLYSSELEAEAKVIRRLLRRARRSRV